VKYKYLITVLILSLLTFQAKISVSFCNEDVKKIYIYYDSSYPSSWFDDEYAWILSEYLKSIFKTFNINCDIINATQLRVIMCRLNEASENIIIMSKDVAPCIVWNGSRNSIINRWILKGGTLVWTGDCEFYYIGFENGSMIPTDTINFVTNKLIADIKVEMYPNEKGLKPIPNFNNFTSLLPINASRLDGMYYEVYGEGKINEETFYDPILIKIGDGYIVRICMTGGEMDVLKRGLLIAELILNRFFNLNINILQYFSNTIYIPKLVIGEYHNWYSGPPGWRHWRLSGGQPPKGPDGKLIVASAFYPIIGPYDSTDENVIRYHILLSKICGIDAFAVDWYGPHSYENYALRPLFEVANELNFKIAIEYEPKIRILWSSLPREDALRVIEKDLKYIFENYVSYDSYLYYMGKPVIFFWDVGLLTVKEWSKILDDLRELGYDAFYIGDSADPKYFLVFDGLYEWIDLGIISKNVTPAQKLNITCNKFKEAITFFPNKTFGAGVWPGFNDTPVWGWGGGPRVYPRYEGKIYKDIWEVGVESKAGFIMIMTFNDWNEGTQIEPAIEYKYLYMNITAEYASKYKNIDLDISLIKIPKLLFDAYKTVENISKEGVNVDLSYKYLKDVENVIFKEDAKTLINKINNAIQLAELSKNTSSIIENVKNIIASAEREGGCSKNRIEKAKVLLNESIEAYEKGNYTQAIELAYEAKNIIETKSISFTNIWPIIISVITVSIILFIFFIILKRR